MSIRYTHDQLDWGSQRRAFVPDTGHVLVPYSYPDGTLLPWKRDKIVIHWGGGTDPDGSDDVPTLEESMAILRGWQRYHLGRGWTDIAYNAAVDNTGHKFRLRGNNRSGATSGDYDRDGIPENHEAFAIVWVGGAAGTPTEAAYRAMAEMIHDIFAEQGEIPVTVHSDHKATACPGPDWRAWVARRGWEDYEESTDMDYQTFAKTIRNKDVIRAAEVGILDDHEADYFIGLLERARDLNDSLTFEYLEFEDLQNAFLVRADLWV